MSRSDDLHMMISSSHSDFCWRAARSTVLRDGPLWPIASTISL
jgi:hypothetical protein